MKKIYSSLFSLIAVFSMNAQLTQINNAPANGDSYSTYRCDSVTTVAGASGANAVWNFAGVTTFSSLVKNYLVQSVSNITYPASNVAVASATNDISYLGSGPGALVYYGGSIGVGTIAGSLTYTAPAVYASYPMSLGTTSTAVTGGSMSIPAFNATGTFTGTSIAHADGSGTINLPGGISFSNTIRVVTSQTMHVATSFPNTNATVTIQEYNYFADGVKAPVFTISTASAVIAGLLNQTSGQHFVTRHTNPVVVGTPTGVAVPEISSDNFNFSVFPNPAVTSLNVTTNHPEAKSVSVYDITGKLVEKQVLIEGKIKMDVSSYNKGLYLYTISSTNNKSLKSGKFTVSQ